MQGPGIDGRCAAQQAVLSYLPAVQTPPGPEYEQGTIGQQDEQLSDNAVEVMFSSRG